MVSLQVDEQTAKLIELQARSRSLSVADYLRSLFPVTDAQRRLDWNEIENAMLALSTDIPGLPDNFSRADIYLDHD